ncbi:hypothetical protein ACIA8K_32110 [Catenuloplanes sp. NPDC051500]|uniref:hypothetical protein n=1 Tax=Catenuloplanes sp. NPDC051500 TaxID=3363959 RepID=UPI003789C82B
MITSSADPEVSLTLTRDQLAALPHADRMRVLADDGRRLSELDYRTLRAALDAGDPAERRWGLHLAVIRRDLDAVRAALADPDLRPHAITAAARLPVPDADLLSVLDDSAPRDRAALYRTLRWSRRRRLADSQIEKIMRRYGESDVARLLPACSPAAIGEWLPRLAPRPGLLSALARVAPEQVLDLLVATPGGRSGGRAGDVIDVISERAPQALADALARDPELWDLVSEDAMGRLMARPGRVIRLIRAAEAPHPRDVGRLSRRARRGVAALPDADVVALIAAEWRYRPASMHATLLGALPPGRRRPVLEAALPDDRLTAEELGTLPPGDLDQVLDRLEATDRAWSDDTRGDTVDRVALRSWNRALPRLRAAVADHRVSLRQAGWRNLIPCARREPDPAVFVAAVVEARRALQDEDRVRATALTGIVTAPARLLAAVPDDLLRDSTLLVLAARDTSTGSLDMVIHWLDRSIGIAAAYGLPDRVTTLVPLLARAVGRRRAGTTRFSRWAGTFDLAIRDQPRVPVSVAAAAWSGLRDRALRGGPDALLEAARLLGPAGVAAVPELDDLLRALALGEPGAAGPTEQAAGRDVKVGAGSESIAGPAAVPGQAVPGQAVILGRVDSGPSAQAAELWVQAGDPVARTVELVKAAPVLGAAPVLWRVVTERRADLLETVLAGAVALPPVRPLAPDTWTSSQVRAVGEWAAPRAVDPEADPRAAAAAVRLVRDPAVLTRIAAEAPAPIAGVSLVALGGGRPRPETVSFLADRAAGAAGPVTRGAASGLRRMVDVLPERTAFDLLAPLVTTPGGAVGAAKEAVRALAGLPLPEVTELLLATLADVDRHRDVRAAAAGGLSGRFADPRVPTVLADALRGPEALRDAVIAGLTPTSVPASARVGPAVLFGEAVSEKPGAELLSAYEIWGPHDPEVVSRLSELLVTALPDDVEWSALRFATDISEIPAGQAVIGRVAADLARLSTRPADDLRAAQQSDDLRAARPADDSDAARVADDAAAARAADDGAAARAADDAAAARTADDVAAALPADGREAVRTDRLTPDAAWRRLGRLVAGLRYRMAAPEALRPMIEACRTAGRHTDEVALLSRLAAPGLAEPEADLRQWDELVTALDRRPARWRGSGRRLPMPDEAPVRTSSITPVLDRLTAGDDPAAAMVALTVIEWAGERTGWDAPWPDELRKLAAHPDPDVRERAREIEIR